MSTFVRKHASKSAWAGVFLSLGTLFINSYFDHLDKAEQKKSIWQAMYKQDIRTGNVEARLAILEWLANHDQSSKGNK